LEISEESFEGPQQGSRSDEGDLKDSSEVEVITDIKPDYPYFAEKRGHEGEVKLWVEVLPSGKCGNVKIIESSGYRELDHAAIEVIPHWEFKPRMVNGRPTVGVKEVTIIFKLQG